MNTKDFLRVLEEPLCLAVTVLRETKIKHTFILQIAELQNELNLQPSTVLR